VQMIWGKVAVDYRVPELLNFPAFTLFETTFPAFKMFMLVVSVATFVALLALLTKTRVGLIIQAALSHPNTVGMLGHNVPLIFMMVFGFGCGLAALAGVIAGPALVTQPAMAASLGPILFVVVVVGGLGSLPGAFVASLAIGLIQTFAVAINISIADVMATIGIKLDPNSFAGDLWMATIAQVAPIIPYLLLVLVLMFRPQGLMGNRDT